MKRSPLAVLFLVVFIDLVGFGIVLPLLPRYAELYQVSGWDQGVLLASFSAMQFIFAPLWGRLSDRIGRRPVLMIGLAGSVIAYTAFGLAGSYAALLASRIAAGIFGATIGTAAAYIADVTSQEERGRGMALIGAAFGIGFTVGPVIGAMTASGHGWLPGFIAAGLSLIALGFAAFALPEPERHRARSEGGLLGFGGLRHVLSTPTLPLVVGLQTATTFLFAMFEGTLSRLTGIRFGLDERGSGYLFGFLGLCLVIAQGAVVRRLMPRVGELKFAVVGSVCLAVGFMGVAVAPSVPSMYPILLVLVFGFAMVTPSLSSLLSRRSPAQIQGEVLGVNQSGLSLARIFGPLLGNVLLDFSDAVPATVSAAGMVVCFLAAARLKALPVPDVGEPGPPPVPL